MKLKFGKKTSKRAVARLKNKARIRRKVEGTAERPRLAVYRGTNNIYAQIIDDVAGQILCSASSIKKGQRKSNREIAAAVGAEIANAAKGKNIENVVFDRSGYVYHGRIKALADAAREAGLKF